MSFRRPAPLTVAVALAVALYAFWMATRLGGRVVTRDVSDIAMFAMSLSAGVAGVVRALRQRGRARWAWMTFAFGTLLYAYGDGSWLWYETIRAVALPVADLVKQGRVKQLRGIGPGIEARLRELVETGEIAELRELERELPPGLVGLGRFLGLTTKRS